MVSSNALSGLHGIIMASSWHHHSNVRALTPKLVLHCLQPLAVELGPGILNSIFDGIQRPLKQIAISSGDVFIPRGVAVPALDITKQWEFHPTGFKVCEQ